MLSAFGVDHGDVSKAFNPMKAFSAAKKAKTPAPNAYKAALQKPATPASKPS